MSSDPTGRGSLGVRPSRPSKRPDEEPEDGPTYLAAGNPPYSVSPYSLGGQAFQHRQS